ncbi:hypothetical protein HOT36_gp32 [Ralstonia phage RPSC1]|uniref:Uncharacterized protein n=1 Tax=Ralstonia phage RPSC1 TaxID=2041351 RepID=A0A2Z2UBX0_9CAUD|nr:hypothetical protein HOT36_gp32 [Ralstonia phage RPSC1]ATN92962.1 hypothetical protein RPSC1_31 [Ralstonia phage RPSC1]
MAIRKFPSVKRRDGIMRWDENRRSHTIRRTPMGAGGLPGGTIPWSPNLPSVTGGREIAEGVDYSLTVAAVTGDVTLTLLRDFSGSDRVDVWFQTEAEPHRMEAWGCEVRVTERSPNMDTTLHINAVVSWDPNTGAWQGIGKGTINGIGLFQVNGVFAVASTKVHMVGMRVICRGRTNDKITFSSPALWNVDTGDHTAPWKPTQPKKARASRAKKVAPPVEPVE